MTLDDQSAQAKVLAEVGDQNGAAEAILPILWDAYADKALTAPRLQELYVKRSVIDVVRAQLRNQVDVAGMGTELQAKKSQRIATLVQMRTETQAEIARLERRLMATRYATATITATTPEVPPWAPNAPVPPCYPDANAENWRGSPYYESLGVAFDGGVRGAP